MSRGICGAVAAVAIMLVGATSANAATQVGETFLPSNCAANSTRLQSTSPSGQYAAPSAGVITSWSYQADGAPPQLKFKVGRRSGGDDFTMIGESVLVTPAPGVLNSYPVQIPVQAGDIIGLYTATPGGCVRNATGYGYHRLGGDVMPPTTATFIESVDQQLDVSAILEPDCDGDGFGDETQDAELPLSEACGKGSRTLTLDANKNKVKTGKKVRLSGRLSAVARQGPCESGQTVELQRKRPKQTTYTTFAQAQTDGQGGFSLKKKVKKTFEFRAQVVETAACTAALSNSEKVKVKKRKK